MKQYAYWKKQKSVCKSKQSHKMLRKSSDYAYKIFIAHIIVSVISTDYYEKNLNYNKLDIFGTIKEWLKLKRTKEIFLFSPHQASLWNWASGSRIQQTLHWKAHLW